MNTQLEPNPPAIIGEVVAGQSAQFEAIRKELQSLSKLIVNSTFNTADLLAEVKSNGLYEIWGYPKFKDYVEQELDMKQSKAHYLIRIVSISKELGIDRNQYTSVKITKLREIFSLDPHGFFANPETNENEPLAGHIVRLVKAANGMSLEEVIEEVKRLKGLVGEDELVWFNINLKRAARDSVVLPAFEKTRRRLGNVKLADGEVKEYTDGVVLEAQCAEVLADPYDEEYQETFPENQTPTAEDVNI